MGETPFTLDIVTLKKVVFSEEIKSVYAPGKEGYFSILRGHTPFVSSLQTGVIRVTKPVGEAFTLATRQDEWYPLAASGLTAWEGVEPSNFSALDSFHYVERGDDLLIPKGYGNLLAHYARGVEVLKRLGA